MKKYRMSGFFVVILMVLLSPSYAQLMIKQTDAESFPDYAIEIHARQPERLDTSAWTFKVGTESIEARLDTVYQPEPPQGSDYLFLIENAPFTEWGAQLDFFKRLIGTGLPGGLQTGDLVYVAQFDWKSGTDPTLVWVNESGMNDTSAISDVINDISRPSSTGRRHRTTEVFPAIHEGLESLKNKRRDGHPAAIILFSREVQNIYNASPSETDLVNQSRTIDIPIYSVGYPPTPSFERYVDKVIRLTDNTFGKRIDIQDINSPEDYAQQFADMLKEVSTRASGWNYRWELHTAAKPGMGTLAVEILANGERTALALPVPTYADWVWNDPVYRRNLLILIGLLIVAIGLSFFFLSKRLKNRKAIDEANRKAEVQELKDQSAKVEEKFNSELDRQERERKAAEDAKVQQEREQLLRERQTNFKKLSNHPLLISSDGANHAITQFEVIIGRSASAGIKLQDDSVSQKHAAISFWGAYHNESGAGDKNFYINDLRSTNGTIVNGHLVQPGQAHRLADNDLIILGSTTLIFRL